MNPTVEYIRRLEALQEGERSRLRRLAGQPLDATLQGFDIFTGVWWPLRKRNERTPKREPSWLVAKLYCSSGIPYRDGAAFPSTLGRCEPRGPEERKRFRDRFDALLCSPLSALDPRLRWALGEIARAAAGRVPHAPGISGIDWAQLLDDLSLWDGKYNRNDTWQRSRLTAHRETCRCHELHGTPQDLWACQYLNATNTERRA